MKLSVLILAILYNLLLSSCHKNKQDASINNKFIEKKQSLIKNTLYKSKSPTIMGVIVTQTLKISLHENQKSGTYELYSEYPAGSVYEGVKLENILRKGTFVIKRTKKFGDIYVLENKNNPSGECYQVMDNKLNEITEENGELNGIIFYKISNKNQEVPNF